MLLDYEIKLENQEQLVQKADDIYSKYLRAGTANSSPLQLAPLNLSIESQLDKVIQNKVDHNCNSIAYRHKSPNRNKSLKFKSPDRSKSPKDSNHNSHRGRARSLNIDNINPEGGFCYYHDVWGRSARHCRPPCAWKEKGSKLKSSSRPEGEQQKNEKSKNEYCRT